MMCDPARGYPFRDVMTSRVQPEQIPTDLKLPATDAGQPVEPPNVRCASLFACVGGWHAHGCPLAAVDGKHVIYGTCENEAINHPGHSYGGGRFHCSGDVGVPVEARTCCTSTTDEPHGPQCVSNVRPYKAPDPVNHPAHYGGDTVYEVIKVCEAWGLDRDAFLFNVVKYVGRPGKGDYLEDLRKARFYLDRRIAQMERDQ